MRFAGMPRYFFDVQLNRDKVGIDLPNEQAAWKEAMAYVREMQDALAPGDRWRLTVRRDVRIVYRIDLKTIAWPGP